MAFPAYTYFPNMTDIPVEALFDATAAGNFVSSFRTTLRNATAKASACNAVNTTPIVAGETRNAAFSFPSGPTLNVTVKAPSVIDPDKPVVVVLPAWGGGTGNETDLFLADGYIVVLIRFQDWFTALAPLYNSSGYLPIWGMVADRIMDALEPLLPAHDGEVISSSATGSLVAPFYAMYRSNVKAIVTNGVMLSLDWLRRNYRITGLANIWDHGLVVSYAPIFVTMAPVPVQHQMGTADGFWPNPAPQPASGTFEGVARGQDIVEVFGFYSILESVANNVGQSIELHQGAQGHLAIDYPAALAFIQSVT